MRHSTAASLPFSLLTPLPSLLAVPLLFSLLTPLSSLLAVEDDIIQLRPLDVRCLAPFPSKHANPEPDLSYILSRRPALWLPGWLLGLLVNLDPVFGRSS